MGGQDLKGGRGSADGWVDGQKALGGKVGNDSFMEWTAKAGQMISGRVVGEADN